MARLGVDKRRKNLDAANNFVLAMTERAVRVEDINASLYTEKKENKIYLIYREIQMGSGAKSYMRKGVLIYEEMK
jgi:hypothetical protein